MQKTLTILRHAKAEGGQDDHARILAERGVREATALGRQLAATEFTPGKIICSTAERTRQTLTLVQQSTRWKTPVDFSQKLYNASMNEILTMLSGADEAIGNVMLIGHNPGLQELCARLAKSGDDEMLRRMVMEFPPCTFATIAFDGAWKDIRSARGAIKTFIVPEK